MTQRPRARVRDVIDAAAVVAALLFVASHFPASLMFSTTTTSGGDMASHFYPAVFMRDVLLPRGQASGWCPGNYAGFPMFQFYFPLPFVLMAAASLAMPLAIAFKLVSQLGTFLLPLCAYGSLRLARVPFPGPALGALGSLCFLFMEANSMWGGNLPSTLAGEFSFSLGFALAVLFVGVLRRVVETGRGHTGAGLLVAAIGWSHGFTLLWAGFVSLTELLTTRGWWRRLGALSVIHGLAIALLGFWLIPLLGFAAWTTPYSHVWVIASWREVLPPILWPAAVIAVSTSLAWLVLSLRPAGPPFPRGLAAAWAGTAMGALLYVSGSAFHVVDIRFVPFFQFGLCLAAAAGFGSLASRLPVPHIWPVVAALMILPFVQQHTQFIPSWIKWNYAGFEGKPAWPTFKAINDHLRGDFRAPRVAYEHSLEYEEFGTARAFESLPLFSGRSTLEGLYMQAASTSPFIFYTQSELSRVNSCPFPLYGCARRDLKRGVEHLRMFNVSHLIVSSPEVKAAAAVHPGLQRERVENQLEIYRIEENDPRYALPLTWSPALVVTPTWKETSYRWFKRAGPDDPVPVFVSSAGAEERALFATVFDHQLPSELPRRALETPPVLEEHLETDRITVTGCRPGHPILIRISYHPSWRAVGGERVWLAGPSLMLVFPKSQRLELRFGGGGPVTVGRALTAAGLLWLVMAVPPIRRRLLERLGRLLRRPLRWVGAVGAWTGRFSPARRRALLGAGIASFVAVMGLTAVAARRGDADGMYRRAQAVYDAGRLEDALPLYRRAQALAPLSNTAVHASYFEAIILFRQERWGDAERAFQRLLQEFPEGPATAEAQYHVGVCRARQGDRAGAQEIWRLLLARHPDTVWAGYARDRLAESFEEPRR